MAVLLLAAFALRIYGLNWDDGQYLHPDERYIVEYVLVGRIHWPSSWHNLFDPAHSSLNPRSDDPATGKPRDFAYGALPLFVTGAAAQVMTWITGVNWHATDHVYKVGRFLSALLDTLTVLLIFLIGRRVFSKRVGLAAAVIAALAPMSIQLAHFFTTDSWLTFFVAVTILWSIRAAESGKARWFAAAGAGFGLAMATKGSVFTLAGLLAVTAAYDFWRRLKDEQYGHALRQSVSNLCLAGLCTVAAFALFEPYALARPNIYINAIRNQAHIVSGSFDVPFTRQYIGTTPVVYQVEQLVKWGFGPVAGVLAIVGLIPLVVRFLRRRAAGETVLLAWFLGYGLVITIPETKFMRYLAPLVPVLAICGGLAFEVIWQFARRHLNRGLAMAVPSALVLGAFLWTASFSTIYAHENTRLAASRWIYANIPPGSAISSEYWDDALPYDLVPGLTGADHQYQNVSFDLYPDYPTVSDVQAIGKALTTEAVTAAAGKSVAGDDIATASANLKKLTPDLAKLPEAQRSALAGALDTAASSLTPAAGDLAGASHDLAAQLRSNSELLGPSLEKFADTLSKTANNEASNVIYRDLQQSDYIILSSNRLLDSIPRSPWRYPVQIRYYQLLQSGQLGFQLVADFHQYPHLGPITFPDQHVDESFTVYDHPRVLIYKKTNLISRTNYDQLMAASTQQPVSQTREAPTGNLMLNQPVGSLPVVSDGRWSERLTHNSLAAFAVWLVLLIILQIVGWPLASLVLGRFADAGWGFARLIAIVVAGYLVWIGASLKIIEFRAIWVAAAVALVGIIGWLARWRWRGRHGLWQISARQRRTIIGAEVVFWVVFGVFLLFRYLNPDSWHPAWGGEKPMEFAHINAMLRSAYFPPYDPWYAGGYINYYYYGLYLISFLIKLTGIPSEIAFNLAQPMTIALLASGGYSLAAVLGRDITRRPRAALPTGLLGTFMLVGIGNLGGIVQWLHSFGTTIQDAFTYWTWTPSRVITGTINEFPYFTGLYADLHAHVVALPITVLAIGLSYAVARDARMALLALTGGRRFGWAQAVVVCRLVLLALVVGTLYPTNTWDVVTYAALAVVAVFMATALLRDLKLRIGVAAIISGVMAIFAYVLFLPFIRHYVTLFHSIARTHAPTDFWQFSEHFGGLLVIVGFGLIVLLLPRRYPTGGTLSQPLLPFVIAVTLMLIRWAVGNRDNRLGEALTGVVVLSLVAPLLLAAWSRSDFAPKLSRVALAQAGIAAMAVLALVLILRKEFVLALLLVVAATATIGWLRGTTIAHRFASLMIAAAACVGAGVELIFVVDDLHTDPVFYRMNTVFKFYNQIWVLFALSGAVLLAKMVVESGLRWPRSDAAQLGFARAASSAQPSERPDVAKGSRLLTSVRASWAKLGVVLACLVLAASFVYPLVATKPRLEQRFANHLGSDTLNGLDWMNYGTLPGVGGTISFKGDLAAIDWFNEHVTGSPVIAEAAIGPYRGDGSRISIATGLPDVLGWDRHEYQQRYPEGIQERSNDLYQLYNTTDPQEKLAILHKYGVEYVIVGDVERMWPYPNGAPYASAAGLAVFQEMVGSSLEIAFQKDGTTVYRVVSDSP